ncbi:MAG: NAD(P)H-binding protein, partial [Acidobacteriota bacterium]
MTDLDQPVLPRHVAVIGAAGGLGQGILSICRETGVGFTAIVRSRPERITEIPHGSRVAIVTSLADQPALTSAFEGADAVLAVLGVTSTSQDRSALLSENMTTVEAAMSTAGVDRIVLVNSLLSPAPGEPGSLVLRFFSWLPGLIGRGATEQRAVVEALGSGALSSLRWTLVRGGLNARGKDEPAVATLSWSDGLVSVLPPLDADGDGTITDAEVEQNFDAITSYLSRQVDLSDETGSHALE